MKITLSYFILGILPTFFMFATHDIMCYVDMNPLCYLKCASFAILALPLTLLGDDKKKGDDDK